MSEPYRDTEPTPKVPGPVMFEHYDAAKHRKLPAWAAPVLGAAVVFHIVLFVTMWIKSIWDIESLDHPQGGADIAIAPPPPPPPPPPKGGERPHDVHMEQKKTVK